ncbi:alpha/beta hydrolase [Streptomyces sp. NRRL S-813]|uniref:alpha/beta hydrolase n=1 Tax=Streptomyces sp. NRRL S-813 TaxID=1463919 RepID=UPI000AE10395|nr:alpha/beta hydrolase [Streptomyces sp. NRRL S-813]
MGRPGRTSVIEQEREREQGEEQGQGQERERDQEPAARERGDGSADRAPARASGSARRWRRGLRALRALLAALVAAAVVVPLSAAARPRIPAPAPAFLAAPTRAGLDAAYTANRANAEQAARMAAAHGDAHRAAVDRELAAPSHRLLSFDGRGSGRAVEVIGDLAHADRVAVLVPGSDTSLDTYDRFRAGASALSRELTRDAPAATRTAVVAWLGYETPGTISTTVLTTGRAEQAAPHLRQFIHDLRGVTGRGPRITLVCHSYGSVVCGRAAAGLDVNDIALVGSPGTGAGSVRALHTRARVWAARGAEDWIAHVPHVHADLFGTTVGFGTDPMAPAFGARTFPAGRGGHSAYFTPGSPSLTNLSRIVLGATKELSGD